jgi:uncharacterized protein (DUF1778 family)
VGICTEEGCETAFRVSGSRCELPITALRHSPAIYELIDRAAAHFGDTMKFLDQPPQNDNLSLACGLLFLALESG